MPLSLPLHLALTLGILSSAFLSSINFSLHLISIRSFLNTPLPLPAPALLTQFKQHYDIAKAQALPMVALTIISYIYGVYSFRRSSWRSLLLIIGIIATIAVPVFSVVWMEGSLDGINLKLFELERDGREGRLRVQDEVVRELLEHWGVMVSIRAGFAAVASVVGLWAVM